MPVCQFLIDFPLFKVEICFGKSQKTIRPLQNQLESLFTMHFDSTSPARSLQAISQCMPPQCFQPSTARNGEPMEKRSPHEHTNALRGMVFIIYAIKRVR
jgi:hypothetical protein